jgi:hypothetical protein
MTGLLKDYTDRFLKVYALFYHLYHTLTIFHREGTSPMPNNEGEVFIEKDIKVRIQYA